MVVLYKNGLVISIARVASFSERLNSHHRSVPLKFSYEQINFEILLNVSNISKLFLVASKIRMFKVSI
jgi:hypothetical protein